MFCGNCGNKISEGVKYCPQCSNKIEKCNDIKVGQAQKEESYTYSSEKKLKVIQAVAMMVLIVLGTKYYLFVVERYEYVDDALYWVSNFNNRIGKFFYWSILVIVLAECLLCMFRLVLSKEKSKCLIQCGTSLLTDGILLKCGSAIFDDWSNVSA